MVAFAALITWRMARNRKLDGGRYALAGATSSFFLLLPWILLVIGLRNGRLHPTALKYIYIFVHLVWLVGPIAVCGHLIASIQSPTPDVVFPGTEDVDTSSPKSCRSLQSIRADGHCLDCVGLHDGKDLELEVQGGA